MQKGTEQVAAGYILYGSSTMMVYTTGMGVTGFTLDPGIGEFCLSHYIINTPEKGTVYSINEGYYMSAIQLHFWQNRLEGRPPTEWATESWRFNPPLYTSVLLFLWDL